MVTNRNRRTPLGNCALIPANTEVVRDLKPGIGDDSERLNTLASGGQPKRSVTVAAVVREISYRTMFRRSSGPLSGVSTSKPKRGRLSVNKGTREVHSSKVSTQSVRILPDQTSPMRRMNGGVAVVVRVRESRTHGEGRQEVSFWTAEGFNHREGSR